MSVDICTNAYQCKIIIGFIITAVDFNVYVCGSQAMRESFARRFHPHFPFEGFHPFNRSLTESSGHPFVCMQIIAVFARVNAVYGEDIRRL